MLKSNLDLASGKTQSFKISDTLLILAVVLVSLDYTVQNETEGYVQSH